MLKVSFIQMNRKLRHALHALCTDQINYFNSDKLHSALHRINYTPRDVIDLLADESTISQVLLIPKLKQIDGHRSLFVFCDRA